MRDGESFPVACHCCTSLRRRRYLFMLIRFGLCFQPKFMFGHRITRFHIQAPSDVRLTSQQRVPISDLDRRVRMSSTLEVERRITILELEYKQHLTQLYDARRPLPPANCAAKRPAARRSQRHPRNLVPPTDALERCWATVPDRQAVGHEWRGHLHLGQHARRTAVGQRQVRLA